MERRAAKVAGPAPIRRRRRIDLNLLAVLVALDDHRSVSAAAIFLGMSQPQVSVALGRLREQFNDAIFVRTAHGMQPTPRAVNVVQSARGVLAQIDGELLADSAFDPATTHQPVVFAISDAGEVTVMPRLLRALRPAAPHALVRSMNVAVADAAMGLESGEIDLAIGYLPDLCRRNFFQQTLFTDSYVSLVRADHPLACGQLTIKQFQRLDHAVVRAPIRHQELLERYLARKRIHFRVGFIGPHVTSLPAIVAETDMIMTIPRRLAQYFLSTGLSLRTVQLPFELPAVEIRQYWHGRFRHDARSRWLRARIASAFHEQDP